MLDLERLEKIKLHRRPVGQILIGNLVLWPDYNFPTRRTEIVLEGIENLPRQGGAFLAMNHTDRFNYFPLQYRMYRLGLPFTATWVKGKYYENNAIGAALDLTNNIPLPSRGYVITTEFRKATGRPPDEKEYRVLRDLVDGKRAAEEPLDADAGSELKELLHGTTGSAKQFLEHFDRLFDRMIRRVVELNRRAIRDLQLDVLVFPEGTRSRRLGRGHNGLAQISQHLAADVIPIGCSGSDQLYPGSKPFSRGGRVVYRIGKPLSVHGPELAPYRVEDDALPFTSEASRRHVERYDGITRVVMSHINDLLDPEYQYSGDEPLQRAGGVDRFV
jgi:1-acyl-sn-glycerol-3-phosphate acyltransferase